MKVEVAAWSCAPVPNKLTVSVDVKQHSTRYAYLVSQFGLAVSHQPGKRTALGSTESTLALLSLQTLWFMDPVS